MKIGYLRVSTEEQKPDRQVDALEPICDELHIEKLSAVAKKRPVYEAVVANMNAGDIFVIWDLDRAYRSAKDALVQLDLLRERGIEIQIASLHVDTATPHGKLIYTIIGALAEFERDLLSQRTKEGLAAAKRRGQRLGPPRKVSDRQLLAAKQKIDAGEATVTEIAALHDVHPWTIYRGLKRLNGVDKNSGR